VNSMQEEIADCLESANVERAALWRLEASSYAALKTVRCRFHQGTLELIGGVPTYFHKQLAQEATRGLPAVTEIVNHISVHREASPVREERRNDRHDKHWGEASPGRAR
jgi:osmotically-inducible protein OsmY